MSQRTQRTLILSAVAVFLLGTIPISARAEDPVTIRQLKQQVEQIQAEREQEHKQLQELEQKINELQTSNQQLQKAEQANKQITAQTTQSVAQIQQKLTPQGVAELTNGYLGEHRFTFNGAFGGSFVYDHRTNENTFSLEYALLPLFQVNDWLLFEGELEGAFETGSGASLDSGLAMAQIFLNKYMVVVAGIFDQPFGDWYEDQSPSWVNPFVTAPLPYGEEALVPGTDIGVQLRGGIEWGKLGQDASYTLWVSNGPAYESSTGIEDLPNPVVGEALAGNNNVTVNTHGKAFGARFRVYPLPVDLNWGRLELEATTYNGKWQSDLWLYSWDVGFAYRVGAFRARGEWIQTYRDMPSAASLGGAYPGCCSQDNREGWYVQFGYMLNGIPYRNLGMIQKYLDHTELLVRYSGVNQGGIVTEDIGTDPGFDFSGSPSVFSPHAREVALGIDYWIAPSIAWKTEVDFELPEAGGTFYTFDGNDTPTASSVGATPNDQAVLTQFVVGF